MAEQFCYVLEEQKFYFDKALPRACRRVADCIPPELVSRLQRYALREAQKIGFEVEGWECEVGTTEADKEPELRMYTVTFTNAKGGMVGIDGIVVKNGTALTDHDMFIDSNNT